MTYFCFGDTSFSIAFSILGAHHVEVSDLYVFVYSSTQEKEKVMKQARPGYTYDKITKMEMVKAGEVNETAILEITMTGSPTEANGLQIHRSSSA